jgi:3-methyladenine DNA glycosylase/8-oxoguanine DNA glycosylase
MDRPPGDFYRAHGPPALPDCPPGLGTLLSVILAQQVSLASTSAVCERVCEKGGDSADGSRLRAAGRTRQAAGDWRNLARTVEAGEPAIARLSRMRNDEVIARLKRINGTGTRSAQVYLLMVY